MDRGALWAAVRGVAKSRTRLSDLLFTLNFHALEKEMATHSSVLAWRIPGTEKPDGLPSLGSHRVGHDWSDLAAAAAAGLKQCISNLITLIIQIMNRNSSYNVSLDKIKCWISFYVTKDVLRSLYIYDYAAAKSFQSCPTLCDPIDGSPPGSPVPGILQPRTLEWVAISFSNAWKWKVKVKSLSHAWLLATPWTAAYQAP